MEKIHITTTLASNLKLMRGEVNQIKSIPPEFVCVCINAV